MSSVKHTAIGLSIGVLLGAGLLAFWQSDKPNSESQASTDKQPLYWVAPMDANYKRDKPGKSPMGMDLIPVYEESDSSDVGPGAVTIAPHVVNNLGVRSAAVEYKSMPSDIVTVGYVQYDQDELIHIHPRVDGWIEKLYVTAAGNPVEKGLPLYTLYSPQLVNAQEELLIAIKRNNASLISAAKERLKALQLAPDFINKLAQQQKVQHTITFYSPKAGVVDNLQVREGFYVKPGNTLLSIAKLDQVWVEAEVFERDTALIQKGLPVTMQLDYLPGKTWSGVVDYVYPSLNTQTRTLRVRLKFDNADYLLKPNMFAQVSIHAAVAEPSLLVPKEAVIRTGKQDRVVLDLGQGQFKSIAVTIGRVGTDYIEILSGLEQDEKVVTSAQFLIDSESSKSSDFKRMSQQQVPSSVWMQGEINSVMAAHKMVNITHGPAPEWDWPEMTMDFVLAPQVDINQLQAGQSLHFEVSKTDTSDYQITGIHIMQSEPQAQPQVSSATVSGEIHSNDKSSRVLNISRGPIEKWNRAAATMDFVADKTIDLDALYAGAKITFTFEVHDDLLITSLTLNAEPSEPAATAVDHSQH
ncbi:efflux RND transporter periplasmic adaptor subunit [Paraglaciecola aestuariivivens]